MRSYDAPPTPENPADTDPDDGSAGWKFRQLNPIVRDIDRTLAQVRTRAAVVLGIELAVSR